MKVKLIFRQVKGLLLICLFVFAAPGCSIDPLVDELRKAREQTIFAIDDAIFQLNLDSESWRFTLEDLNKRMDERIQTTLSFNVPFILNVLNGEAASSVLCITDAIAGKAIYMLHLLKSELITGEAVPLPEPLICNTSVGTIDLNAPRDIRRTITYYGANFFSRDSLSAELVRHTGEAQPINLYKPTHYELVADLSVFDDQATSTWNYLALKFRDEEVSTLVVVKKDQLPPQVRTVTATPPQSGVFPHLTAGDTYFGGNTDVLVSAYFRHNRREVFVDMEMFAHEAANNSLYAQPVTYARGKSRKVFYTAPAGWHIKKIEGRTWYPRLFWYIDNDNNEDIEPTDLGQITIFAQGSHAGSSTRCLLNFNRPVAIVLEEGE